MGIIFDEFVKSSYTVRRQLNPGVWWGWNCLNALQVAGARETFYEVINV